MFLSLSYDHPKGSSYVLSALPLFRLFASSFALFGVWLYVSMCVFVRCTCLWGVWSGDTTRQLISRYTGHTLT
jgi:hypothetical protein